MFLIITMALALSLDAFSVSLFFGLTEKNISKFYLFSILVGLLHFIMPSIGALTNYLIFDKIIISGNKMIGCILFILALSMLIDIKKDKELINSPNIFLIALSVSVDSYFAGIGLKSLPNFSLLYFLVFSVFSCIISLIGCKFGTIGKKKLGNKANYIAVFILFLLSVKYIIFD